MANKFNITCKQATYLINMQQETRISLIDKLKLHFHLKICTCCNLFKKQINQLTTLIQLKPSNNATLSEAKKEFLKEELQKEMSNS